MKSSLFICLLPALLQRTAAQTLLQFGTGQLPTCAQQCTLLNTAQSGCTPPAAPVSGQSTYQSCFCQYTLISALYTNPSAVCGTVCTSAADLKQIQSWYSTLCGKSAAAAAGTTSAAAAAATTSKRATTSTAAAAAAATSTAASAGSNSASGSSTSSITANSSSNKSWISTHYQWVIMVIVLFLGFGALIFAGLWYKRRYNRTHDLASGIAEQPVVWGPHQNQGYTGGVSYPDTAAAATKAEMSHSARSLGRY